MTLPLPTIDVPTYELELPSNSKKIKFRPFLVKEEKLLLIALESKDESTMISTIRQIITNCVISSYPTFDVNELPWFDLEYFFLQLRARSMGETIEPKFSCAAPVTDPSGNVKACGNIIQTHIDILNVKPEKEEGHSQIITLKNNVGLRMMYPKFSTLLNLDKFDEAKSTESTLDMIAQHIDYIFRGDDVWAAKDVSKEELIKFLEGMTQEQFEKVTSFFTTMPKLKLIVNQKCSKCGFEHVIPFEGIGSFFG